MMIEPFTYVPSFKAKASGSYYGDSSGEVILLPMVPGLQTSNGTQWNEDNANLIQLALGNLGRNFILTSSNPGGEFLSNQGAALKGFLADGGAIINTLMQDDFLRTTLLDTLQVKQQVSIFLVEAQDKSLTPTWRFYLKVQN